jgi:chemotaxis protein methyltransferase CheR
VSTTAPTNPFEHLTFIGELGGSASARRSRRREPAPPAEAARLEPASYAFFEALCQRWGLSAARYRHSILARRTAACLRALRVATPAEGLRALARNPAASERALAAVMIGVTEFFRDAVVFDTLRSALRARVGGGQPLRVLSVGCSDGSELYSLAMMLAEDGLLDRAELRGVDCRPAAVATARAGLYPEAAVQRVERALRARYLARATGATLPRRSRGGVTSYVRVADELRAACRFAVADAFGPAIATGPPHDVILCRNLAIYLTPAAAAELWARCLEQLAPEGLLVAGKAERPPAELRPRLSRVGPCVYRKHAA